MKAIIEREEITNRECVHIKTEGSLLIEELRTNSVICITKLLSVPVFSKTVTFRDSEALPKQTNK